MSGLMDSARVMRALRERLGDCVREDAETVARCSRDAGIFRIPPLAIVEPRDPEDIRTVLDVASAEGVPVTARAGGSNTGGAAVGSGIVLLFGPAGPFAVVRPPETTSGGMALTAGAAVRHDTLQQALAGAGYCLPSDPSSGPLSLLGGNIGTRASGPHALRYGAIDRYLLSVRALLADGSLVDTSRPDGIPARLAGELSAIRQELLEDKDSVHALWKRRELKSSCGYNLGALLGAQGPAAWITGLLAGSVGTLGVVLDATVQGRPVTAGKAALLLCFRELSGACRLAATYRDLGAAAVEIMNARSVDLVRSRLPHGGIPDTGGHLLLVEMDGERALEEAHRGARLATDSGEALTDKPIVRSDPAQIGGLWRARKLLLPLLRGSDARHRALSVVNDVGVPPERLAEAIPVIEGIFEHHGLDAFIYGHAGDGNLHLRPLFDLESPDLRATIRAVADEVYACVLGLGGTVTGEHGMGRLRAPFLTKEWGATLVGYMERVKRAFDPAGVLNPGVMFPLLDLGEALERYLVP